MLKRVVLHMGMYHTGTTTLQETMTQNAEFLLSHGIYFFYATSLTWALHRECNPKARFYNAGPADTILQQHIQAAEEQNAHTLVLSHEGMSYNPYYRNLTHDLGNTPEECSAIARHIRTRLHEMLSPFKTTVLFYPRRQDHWIVANYCNALNKNNRFEVTFDTIREVASDCLRYASLMDSWAEHFGHDSILVRPYEKSQLPSGTLNDFCENVLHCPVPPRADKADANVTPGALYIHLLERFNSVVHDENINGIIKGLAVADKARDSYLLMGSTQRREILAYFAQENSRLAREYLGRPDGVLFYESEPKDAAFPKPEVTFTKPLVKQAVDFILQQARAKQVLCDASLASFVLGESIAEPHHEKQTEILVSEAAQTNSVDLVCSVPANFIPERKYVARVLFTEILGYNVLFRTHDKPYCCIATPEDRPLVFLDDIFFASADETTWPLSAPAPQHPITFVDNRTGCELVSFFGSPECDYDSGVPHCHFDILGMAFYLLSRVGEQFGAHDHFGRALPDFQEAFLHRPVINEWLAFLFKLFENAGIPARYNTGYSIHMTHDVDHLGKDTSALHFVAEQDCKAGIKSVFNFLGAPPAYPHDDRYFVEHERYTLMIVSKLHDKLGHSIGFHPGFNTSVNRHLWHEQKKFLESRTGLHLVEGRQHYLKYAYPFTWRIFTENGMQYDTGMSFAQIAGYKAGTGCIYSAFDFLKREQLPLKIYPLLLMDVSYDLNKSVDAVYERFQITRQQCLRYNMPFCMLFHNTFFARELADARKDMYVKLLGAL